MADEVQAAGAPAAEAQALKGVGSERGNMSLDEVAGEFLRAMTQETADEPAQEEVQAEGEPEGLEGQQEPEGETDDSNDTPDEETDHADADEDDVLSQLKPSAAKKAKKRIDKLTARAKEAEEKAVKQEGMLRELQDKLAAREAEPKEGKQDKPAGTFTDRVSKAENAEQLQALYETAKQARKWARENLHEEEVEVSGQVLMRRDITRILNEAEEAIESQIPQQFRKVQVRQQAEQNAYKDFPAWRDESHDDHKRLQEIWGDKEQAGAMLRSMPNGRYLAGVFLEGMKVLEKRNAPKKEEAKAEPKKQVIAPKVPGVSSGVAPSSEAKASTSVEERLKGKGNLTQDDLVALFAEKERARNKQR